MFLIKRQTKQTNMKTKVLNSSNKTKKLVIIGVLVLVVLGIIGGVLYMVLSKSGHAKPTPTHKTTTTKHTPGPTPKPTPPPGPTPKPTPPPGPTPKPTPPPGPTPKPTPPPGPTGKIIQYQQALPANYPKKPASATISGGWTDWATTTQFGYGDPQFPGGVKPSLVIDSIRSFGGLFKPFNGSVYSNSDFPFGNYLGNITINSETIPVFGPMGGAIPWTVYAKNHPNRLDLINSIINSTNPPSGTTPDKSCYIIQPLCKYPKDLLNINTSAKSVSTNKSFVNSPDSVATFKDTKTGQEYFSPAFLIVPYEGCGGDCSTKYPDCANTCKDIQNYVANFNVYKKTNCSDTSQVDPSCQALCYLSQGDKPSGAWNINPFYDESVVQQALYDRPVRKEKFTALEPQNAYLGVTDLTDWGANIPALAAISPNNGHINYCGGMNMHFDMAEDSPLWCQNVGSGNRLDYGRMVSLNHTEVSVNTVVRWIAVPGNIFGNFVVDNTNICSPGGDYIACPNGYWSAGSYPYPHPTGQDIPKVTCQSGVKPILPDSPEWPGSQCANDYCCK